MKVYESDFFPDRMIRSAYRAQRDEAEDQGRHLQALERRIRELEAARLNDSRLAALEAAAKGQELAVHGSAILDLLDRVKVLEARRDGQGRDGTP